jgi:hypothetical protein
MSGVVHTSQVIVEEMPPPLQGTTEISSQTTFYVSSWETTSLRCVVVVCQRCAGRAVYVRSLPCGCCGVV